MFAFDFMRQAFLAGTIVAIMGGFIGVFVIARGLSFITHTFSHIGFSGAAFAVFMGWNPFNGLLLFTTLSAVSVGQLGVKYFRRDASINVILSVFLGMGILFLALSTNQASFVSNILFGSVVGIGMKEVWKIAILSSIVFMCLIVGYRMLKFDSFDPVGAEAAGLPVRKISIGFLVLLSIAVAEAVQIVGALLVFTLMTIPASTARLITPSIFKMIICSILLSVASVWIGLTLGYYTDLPISFFITSIQGIFYISAILFHQLSR
ncbi:metal ABC transporter permease [Aquibacillus salsiterrae]|uniref:Metal ABC transporter permease n=1 Tax=Aquibacillus salsiterrae TaxID=2950439 RepID=A0A9X3WAS8_9BACI|nr:metal ABC transporter permease [Aquibacillus salsiterrae]MDC3415907.1 metal ABC transporter permease [Aquibacillus salsiterrae]